MSDAYLIRKHGGYYRPNSQGYTTSAILAGRYTREEADSESHPNGPDGPRDGMTFIHEDDVRDEDWLAYREALRQASADALREAARICEAVSGAPRDQWDEGDYAMGAADCQSAILARIDQPQRSRDHE